MAKKKNENTLQYLQMPLPEGGKYSKMSKMTFGGLNKRYTLDSGDLTMESNISTNEYPYLTPSQKPVKWADATQFPISMFGFDDFLILSYFSEDDESIKIDYITADGTKVYTALVTKGILTYDTYDDLPKSYEDSKQYFFIRDEKAFYIYTDKWEEIHPVSSVVQFNVYDTPTDPLTGQYVKKLLIFPDKCSMYMNIVDTNSNPENWNADDLKGKDLSVMYCYQNGNKKYYYTIVLVEDTEDGDENKVTYKRVLQKKYNDNSVGFFLCDGMEALVKEYYNNAETTDESGAKIFPPPDTASHNYYYRNSYNNDIYRWCEYETKDGGTAYGWKVSVPPAVPNLKYATVHLSRVFGVDNDRVYASGFNDYANWNLDTTDEYNEANSWCSPSQSNTKAGGSLTGITTFQNHVICFKHDFMHEIYNTKNPFRLQDIYAEGAIDNRTIQDVDGKLIFVSDDDVKVYTGSNPRIIGYNLNMSKYTYAVSGTDNRNYYLYCEDAIGTKHLYVYDTFTELWSEQSIDKRVINFAHNKNGMYMLLDNGKVYKMDTDDYSHKWSFETDLITNKTVNIKHIKKLQMLVDIAENSNMQVYILYDDEEFDEKTSHCVYTSKRYGRLPIRVKPRKTASYGFKLHFEGEGYIKLYELEIFVEAGGDMYVGS